MRYPIFLGRSLTYLTTAILAALFILVLLPGQPGWTRVVFAQTSPEQEEEAEPPKLAPKDTSKTVDTTVVAQKTQEEAVILEAAAGKKKNYAHGIGFGLTASNYSMTDKETQQGISVNVEHEQKGYNGIYFQYHVVKVAAKLYFSPNLIYSYTHRTIKEDNVEINNHRRYVFFGFNAGLNFNELLGQKLPIEPFLEGGLGIITLIDGKGQNWYNWHYLILGMDIFAGGRYWITKDKSFGVEGNLRYVNGFADSGLNSKKLNEFLTFNDFKLGMGIVFRP